MALRIAFITTDERPDPAKWSAHWEFFEGALRERPDVEISRFTWWNWMEMPKGLDLYFFLDFHPSLYQVHKYPFTPRAFYWWDSFHWSFVFPAQLTELFDRSYFAEWLSATTLRSQAFNVEWLPMAVHPACFRPINADLLYHYAFIGQQDSVICRKGLSRAEFLWKLRDEPGLLGYAGMGAWGEGANLVYNQARVLFDRTIYDNLGTRFFECIGSGGFMLMNRTKAYNGIDMIARDGVHYVSYDDTYGDFIYKLRYYASHDEDRRKIAKQGYEHILGNHTYAHRVTKILLDFHLL